MWWAASVWVVMWLDLSELAWKKSFCGYLNVDRTRSITLMWFDIGREQHNGTECKRSFNILRCQLLLMYKLLQFFDNNWKFLLFDKNNAFMNAAKENIILSLMHELSPRKNCNIFALLRDWKHESIPRCGGLRLNRSGCGWICLNRPENNFSLK